MKHLHVFSLCLLALGCGADTSVSAPGSSSGSGGTQVSFEQSDLNGSWVGRLIPDVTPTDATPSDVLFYFTADEMGYAELAADSLGNEWFPDDILVSDLLVDGELAIDINPNVGLKRMQLHGEMSDSMTELSGEYMFNSASGAQISGAFTLSLASDAEYFSELDYSGVWAGGFGVGHRQNERVLTFELSESGLVVSGELVNTVTNEIIHTYSASSGNFALDNTTVGRINNFVIVADDGSIATCDFLLVARDLELIAGVGTDSEVGEAMIEIRR